MNAVLLCEKNSFHKDELLKGCEGTTAVYFRMFIDKCDSVQLKPPFSESSCVMQKVAIVLLQIT